MGIQRTAIILAISQSNSKTRNHTYTSLTSGTTSTDLYSTGNYFNGTGHRNYYAKNDFAKFHGNPNIVLGLAMLTVIGTILCLLCYCCHRKTKRASAYLQNHRWFDNEDVNNMEVYSVEQYYGAHERADDTTQMRNEMPPSYHECIRVLATKPQFNFLPISDFEKLLIKGTNHPSIDNDRLNNNHSEETESNAGSNNSNATTSTSDANGNLVQESDENTLDMINGKGVIKLDMSRIIDPTGLPTYEAALKLKSSSYI